MPADREVLDVDVLFVGAGPACLAGAFHLSRLLKRNNITGLTIAVIEKAKEIGAHAVSGAVVDPRALHELLPDHVERGAPIESRVEEDFVCILTDSDCVQVPVVPRALHNHGFYIMTLGRLTRWMGKLVEESAVDIFTGFPAVSALIENNRVVGVRTGDKGINKHGEPKNNFEPGVDIRAKITVLGEGPRGTVTRQVIQQFGLDRGRNPQVYATGVKEIWQFPKGYVPPGRVVHTMGWPLKNDAFGGGFIYSLTEDRLCVGFVVGLDYRDPFLDPHHEFQRFKTHPKIRSMLDGGQMVEYGAKTIPEGGYTAVPQLAVPGCMLVGDSAGLLDAQRLKGVHLAIKSGMLAAETAMEALQKGDGAGEAVVDYDRRVRASWIMEELYQSRNFKTGFKHGFLTGVALSGLAQYAGGWSPLKPTWGPGHRRMQTIEEYYGDPAAHPVRIKFDDKLTFRKTMDVFHSGTIHDEDSPAHLLVKDTDLCVNRCTKEYGNPCQHFCPAAVYEWVGGDGKDRGRLQINFTNCVHCKTCDIMDPYENIVWVPPEGGGGPAWKNL